VAISLIPAAIVIALAYMVENNIITVTQCGGILMIWLCAMVGGIIYLTKRCNVEEKVETKE
jgi:hypothetical protein